jgi:hypothetical protein
MKPNILQYGTRYADDSGWERCLQSDRHAFECRLEIMGSRMTFPLNEIDWLIEALNNTKTMLALDK